MAIFTKESFGATEVLERDEQGRPVPLYPPIQATLLREEILSAPAESDANSVPVIDTVGSGFIDGDHDYDAGGNLFVCIAQGLMTNTNITWVEVYKCPRGGPFPAQPQWRIDPTYKLDGVSISHTGTTTTFGMETHAPGAAPRHIAWEFAPIANSWVYSVQDDLERGGPGGFLPEGGSSGGGGLTDADFAHIEAIVKFQLQDVVGAEHNNDLVKQFTTGNQSMRQAVRGLDKQAMLQLFDPANTEPDAVAFRFLFANFVRDRAYEGARAALGHQVEEPDEPTKAAIMAHVEATRLAIEAEIKE